MLIAVAGRNTPEVPTPVLGPFVSLPGQTLLHAGDEEATGRSLTG